MSLPHARNMLVSPCIPTKETAKKAKNITWLKPSSNSNVGVPPFRWFSMFVSASSSNASNQPNSTQPNQLLSLPNTFPTSTISLSGYRCATAFLQCWNSACTSPPGALRGWVFPTIAIDTGDGRNPAPPGMYKNPVNNGSFSISTGAGFLPSTVWYGVNDIYFTQGCETWVKVPLKFGGAFSDLLGYRSDIMWQVCAFLWITSLHLHWTWLIWGVFFGLFFDTPKQQSEAGGRSLQFTQISGYGSKWPIPKLLNPSSFGILIFGARSYIMPHKYIHVHTTLHSSLMASIQWMYHQRHRP